MPRPIKCPCCGIEIARNQLSVWKLFPCPSCGERLSISLIHGFGSLAAGILLCGLLGYVFGLRNGSLLFFTVVLWAPVTIFVFGVWMSVMDPHARKYNPKSAFRRPILCPSCQLGLDRFNLRFGNPFPCPSCEKPLCISSFYSWISTLVAVLICGVLVYAFGLGNRAVFVFIVVLYYPIAMLLGSFLRVILNPRVRIYHSRQSGPAP
jgi:hypothetical protein